MGIENTKLIARQTVHWPNINSDGENCVIKCIWERYRNNNTKEKLLSHLPPNLSFKKVVVDLIECKDKSI